MLGQADSCEAVLNLLGSSTFPLGHRPISLRALVNIGNHPTHTVWTAPNHTAQDFIGWVRDLQPDTLVRFFSGPLNGALPLGQVTGYPSPDETMTVLEFVQNCLSACANANSTTLFPRLSMDVFAHGISALARTAQDLWSIMSNLNPPQTLLSLDIWDDTQYTEGVATGIIRVLRSIGFQGFACGANAAQGVPDGLANFALLIEGNKPLSHFKATLSQQPSIKIGFRRTDFPFPLHEWLLFPPDKQAEKITSFFQSQGKIGSVPLYYAPYIYWSDINAPQGHGQFGQYAYDTTQIFTSPSGPYAGKSLYETTRELMNQYNSL
jgi:hypothetical protein